MRAARRAGRPLARSAVPMRTAVTPLSTPASYALTPKSVSPSRRATATDAATPHATPTRTTPTPLATTLRKMSAGAGAERDANADLARALRDEIHRHAVGAADGEHEGQRRRTRRASTRTRPAAPSTAGSDPPSSAARKSGTSGSICRSSSRTPGHRRRGIACGVQRHHHVGPRRLGRAGSRGRAASAARVRSASRRRSRRRPSSTAPSDRGT